MEKDLMLHFYYTCGSGKCFFNNNVPVTDKQKKTLEQMEINPAAVGTQW